jgi:uncharacterized protein involved in cysteine biosynthesis
MIATGSLAITAFTALCLAMPKHFAQVWQRKPSDWQRHVLRATGWLSVVGTALLCIFEYGTGIGLVMFCGLITAASAIIAWLLPYRPNWIPRLGVTMAMLFVISLALSAL